MYGQSGKGFKGGGGGKGPERTLGREERTERQTCRFRGDNNTKVITETLRITMYFNER